MVLIDNLFSGVLAEVACLAHNQEVVGANPTSATIFHRMIVAKITYILEFFKMATLYIMQNLTGRAEGAKTEMLSRRTHST